MPAASAVMLKDEEFSLQELIICASENGGGWVGGGMPTAPPSCLTFEDRTYSGTHPIS
jgi:hypothetical protein